MNNSVRLYVRLSVATIAAVYFLIALGGIVRATGAGLGCPDWPMCFGRWWPPTDIAQLPADYLTRFGGIAFDFVKAWTEYLNRWAGIVIGLLITAVWCVSWRRVLRNAGVFRYATAAFIGVLLQGGIGGVVVRSHLLPWVVTVHMIFAQAIVLALIHAVLRLRYARIEEARTSNNVSETSFEHMRRIRQYLIAAMCVTAVQIVLGTQVREAVDIVGQTHVLRESWIAALPRVFDWHRVWAMCVVLINAWCVLSLATYRDRFVRSMIWVLALLVVGTFVCGVALVRFDLLAVLQPVHLLFASLILGAQYTVLCAVTFDGKHIKNQGNTR